MTSLFGSGSWDGHQNVPTDARIWVRLCAYHVGAGYPARLLMTTSDLGLEDGGFGGQHLSLVDLSSGQRVEGKVSLEKRIQAVERGVVPDLPFPVIRIDPDHSLKPRTPYRVELYSISPGLKLTTNIATTFTTGEGPAGPPVQWGGPTEYGDEGSGSDGPRWLEVGSAESAPPVFVITPVSSLWPWASKYSSDVMFTTGDGKLISEQSKCQPSLYRNTLLEIQAFSARGKRQSTWWVAIEDGDLTAYSEGELALRHWSALLASFGLMIGGAVFLWRGRRRRRSAGPENAA